MAFRYCDIDKDCPFKRILTSADPLDYSKIKILCVGNKKYCKEAKEKEQRTSFAKNKERGISYSQLEKVLDIAIERLSNNYEILSGNKDELKSMIRASLFEESEKQ